MPVAFRLQDSWDKSPYTQKHVLLNSFVDGSLRIYEQPSNADVIPPSAFHINNRGGEHFIGTAQT